MATEKRLIDANAMREDWLTNGENEYTYDTNAILDSIDAQPTVDAVEVPPVNIGDTVWFIIRGKIYKTEIVLLQWCKRKNKIDSEIRGEVYGFHCVGATFSDWGKTVFSTKEEAEKVLYQCENCFCGTYRSCEGCSYGERRTDTDVN